MNEFKAILHLIIQIRQIPRHMTVKITGQRARPAIGDCVHPAVHQSAIACRRSAAVESVNCGIAGAVGCNNCPVVGGEFGLAFDVVASGCVVGVGDDLVGLGDVVVVVVSGGAGGE